MKSRATVKRICAHPSSRPPSSTAISATRSSGSKTSPGVAVRGYRAPSFSIGHGNLWAFDRIAAAGYRYSSSVYPVQHDHYGMPDAPRFPYRVSAGLLEIPVSTARVFGRNLPAGGGGYFRLAPYALSRWAIDRVNRVDRQPAIFYFHPWEIDPAAAACQRHRTEDSLSALRQSESDRTADCGNCSATFAGTGWIAFSISMQREIARRSRRDRRRRCRSGRSSRLTVRRGRRSSQACPDATFFHRIDGATSSKTSSATARTTCWPSAAAQIAGVLPLAQVKSLLFGHSLVSLPFAVYGGAAVSDDERARDAARRGGGACATLGG